MRSEAEKLTTALKYRHFALVVVDGPFPVDALRYDRCYPYEETDAREIESSLNFGEPNERRYIVICKFSETAQVPWFMSFWQGQSRLQMYSIGSSDIPGLRTAVKDAKVMPSTVMDWINNKLFALVRKSPH